MKNRKSYRIYKRRRAIAKLYICISSLIGLIMAVIGSGLDSDNFCARLYWIGMILLISGVSLNAYLHRSNYRQ